MDKAALRRQLRSLRKAFLAKGVPAVPACSELTAHAAPLRVIAGYVSNGFEPDVVPLLTALVTPAQQIALPWLAARDAPLQFRRWRAGEPLVDSGIGFAQPEASAPLLHPELILTPLIGYDRHGNRLGQGAGHYDRAFAAYPDALRIGVAWSCQEVEIIPCDHWDMPLDAVMTELGWYTPRL